MLKQVIKLTIPAGQTYLSDTFLSSDIPAGLFCKSETGCGATTVVLKNNYNYIIAVPNISLILNKCAEYNKETMTVLPVLGNGRNNESYIMEYINDPSIKVKKIMVTYDSLHKLFQIIGSDRLTGKIPMAGNDVCHGGSLGFQIAVDEFHHLLKSYIFRSEAIDNMLSAIKPYINNVRFISATPIPDDCIPEDLMNCDRWELEWTDSKRISVECVYSKSPIKQIVSIINDYKNGQTPIVRLPDRTMMQSNEMFVYVNCVSDIAQILKASGLTPEETRVVCANNDKNVNKLPSAFKPSPVLDRESQLKEIAEGKRFTFITSTAFEGVDFFSPTAVTYIVSNIGIKSTVLDISGDVKQIVGRVRDDRESYGVNPFRFKCYHIHNSGIIDGGIEKFNEEFERFRELGLRHIEVFQTVPDITDAIKYNQNNFSNKGANFYCVSFDQSGQPYWNELKEKALKHEYKNIYSSYANGVSVRAEHEKAGRNVTSSDGFEIVNDCPTIKPVDNIVSFKDRLDRYEELMFGYDADMWIRQQFEKDPDNKVLVLGYKLLGKSKFKALEYKEGAIRKAVTAKIASIHILPADIYKTFQIGERYTNKDIKERLKKLYKKHCIPGTPKASDLELYFNLKHVYESGNHGFQIESNLTYHQKEADDLRLFCEQFGITMDDLSA